MGVSKRRKLMVKKKVLLMVRIGNVPVEIEKEWNRWYDTTHIPNRLSKPGFLLVRRFFAIRGESKYLTLYELDSLEALKSEAYVKLREWEASLPPESFEAITLRLPGFTRGVYEQIYPEKEAYKIPDTDILFTIGHDVPANREEEFNAWYNTEHIPAMMSRVPGFVTARRFRNVGSLLTPGSGKASSSPQYVTLYDLSDEKVLDSEVFKKETNSPWSSWVRSWYTRRFRILARRIYPK
jgi:hypothetical protein